MLRPDIKSHNLDITSSDFTTIRCYQKGKREIPKRGFHPHKIVDYRTTNNKIVAHIEEHHSRTFREKNIHLPREIVKYNDHSQAILDSLCIDVDIYRSLLLYLRVKCNSRTILIRHSCNIL